MPLHTEGNLEENAMPKGQQRSNREKKKPKKERTPAPLAPRIPGLPNNPWKKLAP